MFPEAPDAWEVSDSGAVPPLPIQARLLHKIFQSLPI